MSRLQNNFTQVPNNIILLDIPTCALKVMLYLLTYQHKEDIYPSLQTIASGCNSHVSSVKRGLKFLEQQKFITINRKWKKDHRSHSYIINFEQIDGDCVFTPEECEISEKN